MYKDTFWVTAAQIMGIAIALSINVILTRCLSKPDFGFYQLALAYVNVVSILTLPGFNQANIKGGAKSYDNIFFPTLKYRAIGSVIGIMVFLCVGSLFIFVWNREALGFLIIIGSLFFPICPFQQFDSLLMGKRRFDLSRGIFIVSEILRLLLIAIVAITTKNLRLIFITTIIAQAIHALGGFWITLKVMKLVKKNVQFEKKLLSLGIKMTLIGVWSIIAGRIERIMLGMMDPKFLAVYHIGAIVPRGIRGRAKPILSVPSTHWLKLSKMENLVKIKKNWWKFVLFGSLLAAFLWFTCPYFIPKLFGNQYMESVRITQWLSISMVFIFLQTMILNVAVYQGEENFFMKLFAFQSILKIGLFLILIPYFNLNGAVISILSAETIIFFVSLVWFINRVITTGTNPELQRKQSL
jgi:O-antigen/teichoic acid export membrane protein